VGGTARATTHLVTHERILSPRCRSAPRLRRALADDPDALIYQHTAPEQDREIANALSSHIDRERDRARNGPVDGPAVTLVGAGSAALVAGRMASTRVVPAMCAYAWAPPAYRATRPFAISSTVSSSCVTT
jgi:hypothetical protein